MKDFKKIFLFILAAAFILTAAAFVSFADGEGEGDEPGEPDPHVHVWGEWTVTLEPTCGKPGEREHTCTECGETESEEIEPTGEHTWGEWVTVTDATCIYPGKRAHTCTVCGTVENEEVKPTGIHTWGEWTVTLEPTCGKPGEREHTCKVCSFSDTEEIDPTGAHTWGEWTVISEPTYFVTGERTRTCAVCETVENEEIARVPNPFSDVKLDRWYSVPVFFCYDNGFMVGVSADTFSLSAPVSRAMIVQIMARLAGADLTNENYLRSDFGDVPNGSWYTAAVEWAYKNGLAAGIGGGLFAPSKSITRQELAVFLFKFADFFADENGAHVKSDAEYSRITAGFKDSALVAAWAKPAMGWSIDSGVMHGTTSEYLSPTITLTRAQLAEIVFHFNEKYLSPSDP